MIMDSPPTRHREKERKLVVFLVQDVLYGVDIMKVREIINPIRLIDVPAAPDFVIGVADHRRAVVPIIDIRKRVGLESIPDTRRTKWVLVNINGRTVGIRVEWVTDVLKVEPRELRETHPLMEGPQRDWVRRVYGSTSGLIFEIEIEKVVQGAHSVPLLADEEGLGHGETTDG